MGEIFNLIYFPILTIGISIAIYSVFKKLMRKVLKFNSRHNDGNNRRQKTLARLFGNTAKCILIIIAGIAILNFYGINTNTILASLGVVSVVLGLAFQDILKDLLAGIFILLEGNVTIGDTVQINNFKGEVVEIGLKNTKIKSYTGEIKVMANRNITEIINFSLNNSLAVVDIKFDIKEDTNKIDKALKKLLVSIEKYDNVSGDPLLLGVDQIDATTATYRITVPTKSNESTNVQRQINEEVKQIFEDKSNQIGITDENV